MKNVLVGISTLLLLCSMVPAFADDAPLPELYVIQGYQASSALLAGDYAKAVKLAKAKSSIFSTQYDKAAMHMVLCVAYIKSGNFDAAETSCETAEKIARTHRLSSVTRTSKSKILELTRSNNLALQTVKQWAI